MGKVLIIAEKPSAARAIADALGGFRKRENYLESDRYYLSWAIGHLVQLCDPEDYDKKWKSWSLGQLPIIPSFRLKANFKTRQQLKVLEQLMKQSVGLINACDSGREGELVFRYIVNYLKMAHLPTKRLWTASLTKEAIREAFAALKPASEYDNLYYAAECRSRGDWLVGINASRGYTCKFGDLLSIGRVQTPTLALLVKRQQEIDQFESSEYWELYATFSDGANRYRGKWFCPEGSRFDDEAAAKRLESKVKGQLGSVLQYEDKETNERPPLLFDLTSLQRTCNRLFDLTAAQTLKTAQTLYERKLITYPRTDSPYLSSDLVRTLPSILAELGRHSHYSPLVEQANRSLVTANNRRVVRDDLIGDHHAIIPTPEPAKQLKDLEQKVYDLIARRFLAQFYPPAVYREVSVVTVVAEETFQSKSKQLISHGWRLVEQGPWQQESGTRKRKKQRDPDEEMSDDPIPKLSVGQRVTCADTLCKQGKTQPPKPHTEDSLLSAMEHAGKELEDHELKQAMKEHGLGTPATRAGIIERLKQVGYIEVKNKALLPTQKGKELIRLIEKNGPQLLLSAELTGQWEKRIADVQKGTYTPGSFMENIKKLTHVIVEHVQKAEPERLARTELAIGSCPLCGGSVIKAYKSWECSNKKAKRCSFTIWPVICGKTLTENQIKTLLTKGQTGMIKGFVSKQGKKFQAQLTLENGRIELKFS
ncbi:type IA DNA topoisomerase [Brevibacillus sp. H7]|uniref:type IA DNA topoisomerase n=1 Tax=Brevibacillus sp. H7 TaxID=3349138 RepID=UPI0037FAFED6